MSQQQLLVLDNDVGGTDSPEALEAIVRAVEKHHGIEETQLNKPSLDYAGAGMFKGEAASAAALGWALRCRHLGQDQLEEFLRYVAGQLPLLHENRFSWRIYTICSAYESGVGHGQERDGHDNVTMTLFGDNYECNVAYCTGYKEGAKRRDWEERKQKKATPKPFPAMGRWFPTDVFDYPLREFAPGRWEAAVWPSEKPKT
jgi:hypothetical protein